MPVDSRSAELLEKPSMDANTNQCNRGTVEALLTRGVLADFPVSFCSQDSETCDGEESWPGSTDTIYPGDREGGWASPPPPPPFKALCLEDLPSPTVPDPFILGVRRT